jgi:hypothetical protein
MASTKKNNSGPRRSPEIDEIARGILDSYHPTEGCPPLASHWGGYDLAKTDWLRMFAEQIAVNAYRSLDAWRALAKKCDTSWIIELLYLLTFRGKSLVDLDQDTDHAISAELEKRISAYTQLGDDLVALIENYRHSIPMIYMGGDLLNEIRALEESKKRLEILRDKSKKSGSYKRNPRDWYLFLIAAEARSRTGRSHMKEMATLIEAARAAHKERTGLVNEDVLQKRLQRWMYRMNAKISDGTVLFLGKTEREKPDPSAHPEVPF